jgi:hypothetical protein
MNKDHHHSNHRKSSELSGRWSSFVRWMWGNWWPPVAFQRVCGLCPLLRSIPSSLMVRLASLPAVVGTCCLPCDTVVAKHYGTGTAAFPSFDAAYAAVQRCAASVGGLLKKNGAKSSQKKPYKMVAPPFEMELPLESGEWPQLTLRLACDHRHDSEYERTRNATVNLQSKTPNRRRVTNKGDWQQHCCNLSPD